MKKVRFIKNLCAGFLISVMFFGCSTTDTVVDLLFMGGAAVAGIAHAARDISPEEEYCIGRAVTASLFTSYSPYENEKQEAYLNKICGAIVLNSERPEIYNGYHVKIIDLDEVNAFATSAGHILVSRGLIACAKSEDALAAAIAHEIAHIQLQHSLNAIKKSRRTEASLLFGNAAFSALTDFSSDFDGLTDIVNDIVPVLVKNGYSKKQEFAADKYALTLMQNAGYNVSGMNEILLEMQKGQKNAPGGFSKTHPSPKSRIKKVKSAVSKMERIPDTSAFRKARFSEAMN